MGIVFFVLVKVGIIAVEVLVVVRVGCADCGGWGG